MSSRAAQHMAALQMSAEMTPKSERKRAKDFREESDALRKKANEPKCENPGELIDRANNLIGIAKGCDAKADLLERASKPPAKSK